MDQNQKPVPVMDPEDPDKPLLEELIFQDFQNTRNVSILGPNALSAGVGLKSLDYELMGGNPEHGKRSAQKVNIVFWLESLKALTDNTSGPAFVDLISDPSTKLRATDPETGKVILTNELNPAYRTLHMLYGWGTPNEQAGVMRSEIRKALKSTETLLKLELVSAEIDLKQDGTATLTVSYTAAQEAQRRLQRKDVLRLDKNYMRLVQQAETAYRENKERSNSIRKGLVRDLNENKSNMSEEEYKESLSKIDQDSKADEEALRDMQTDIKNMKINAREEMYRSFLEKLEESGKLFYIDIPVREFEANQYERGDRRKDHDYNSMTDEEKRAYDLSRATSHRASSLNVRPVTSRSSTASLDNATEAMNNALERERGAVSNQGSSADAKQPEPQSKYVGKSEARRRVDKETRRIYFMRFGDILNTAVSNLEEPGEATVATGPIIWNDARTGNKMNIDLVDIPVSLDYFQVWWIDNVVTKQREEWKLEGFVQSAVGNLIVNVLGSDCFYGTGGVTGKTSIAMIDNVKGTGNKPPIKKGERIGIKDIPIKSGGDHPRDSTFSYIYIFSHTFNMNFLEGDRKKDSEKGIYHFSVGNSKGLVKEISFKKVGNKTVDSARIMRNLADNPNDELGLSRLHSQYNADVTLVGNSIFKPGQFIYINPSIKELGSISDKNSIARQIGIGGYFLVTKVSGQVGPEGWTTSLGATWQSFGGIGVGAPRKANVEEPMMSMSQNESSPSESPLPMSMSDIPMSGG